MRLTAAHTTTTKAGRCDQSEYRASLANAHSEVYVITMGMSEESCVATLLLEVSHPWEPETGAGGFMTTGAGSRSLEPRRKNWAISLKIWSRTSIWTGATKAGGELFVSTVLVLRA